MTVYEMAQKYYPRLWDRERLEALLAAGLPPTATAWQAIGYKQFLAAADGRCTVAEAIEEVKLRSRQYAKRQLTWFRRERDVIWVDKSAFDYDEDKILSYMLQEIEKRGLK